MTDRPFTTLVLAMSADGKIADFQQSSARFGSRIDKDHLEGQVAKADAVLFGAGTLRAYGTTLRVSSPSLVAKRQADGRSPQPIQIVCSPSGTLDPSWPFFRQPVPRWLITTPTGAVNWQESDHFESVLMAPLRAAPKQMTLSAPIPATPPNDWDWRSLFTQLHNDGIHHLAVLGGSQIVTALFTAGLIDEFWLTICPLILGGTTAPTPVAGPGWLQTVAPRLELIEFNGVNDEMFIHYRIRSPDFLY